MKLTLILVIAFLLLAILANTRLNVMQTKSNVASDGIPLALGKTIFYNFTSDQLFCDDEGDWNKSAQQGIDIKRIYLACDAEWIYMLWVKSPTGSHVDEVYFDVGESNGYSIGLLNATYRFNSPAGALYKWNSTEFDPLITLNEVDINTWGSGDGKVMQHVQLAGANETEEFWEMKIALSIFGYPKTVKIVDTILYSGLDQAPDDSFILVQQNASQRFIASFYAKTSGFDGRPPEIRKQSIGYYNQGFNASFRIMNFEDSSLLSLNLSLDMPAELTTNLFKTSWDIELEPHQYFGLDFNLRAQNVGRFNLRPTISSIDYGNIFSQVIPLDLLVIPKMNVTIAHSQQMKAGFPSDLNITAVNPDMTNADFSVVLYGQFAYLWQFTPLALKLGPNSSMTISSEIVPLAIINPWDVVGNSSYLELALELEGLPICSSGSLPSGRINITEPNVHFVLQFPQEVLVGNAFYINISAVNEENETVSASFAIETGSANGLSLEDSSFKQETAQIPPNSNITFSYKFRATEESKSDHGSTISFQVSRGGSGAVDLYSANIRIVNLLTSMWPAIQYGLLFMFLAIIIGLAVYYRRRRKHQKELSRATDSTGLKTLWLGLRFT